MWERGLGEIFPLHKFCLDSSIYLLEKNIQANALAFVNIFYFSARLLAFVSIRKLEQSFACFFAFEACQNIFWVSNSHCMHDKIFLSLTPNQMNKLNYFSPKKWWKRNEISPLGVKSGFGSIFMKTLKNDFLMFYSTETTIANVTKIFHQIKWVLAALTMFLIPLKPWRRSRILLKLPVAFIPSRQICFSRFTHLFPLWTCSPMNLAFPGSIFYSSSFSVCRAGFAHLRPCLQLPLYSHDSYLHGDNLDPLQKYWTIYFLCLLHISTYMSFQANMTFYSISLRPFSISWNGTADRILAIILHSFFPSPLSTLLIICMIHYTCYLHCYYLELF